MPQINQLSAVEVLNSADQVPVYDASCGDARKAALSTFLDYIKRNITESGDFDTQYAAPSSTGFVIAIDSVDTSVHLILTPTAGFAAGTITFPAYPGAVDKQEVLINCTQSIAAWSMIGSGVSVVGAPTSSAANAFFRFKFDLLTKNYYRVG